MKGYRTGLILSIVKVLALILGVLIAMHFSSWLSTQLFQAQDGGFARIFPMLSYIILFTIVVWGTKLLGKFVQKAISIPIAGTLNRLSGAVLYTAIFLFIASTFLWLGAHMSFWNPDAIENSIAMTYLQPLAPWVFDHAGVILPFAKDTFQQLNDFFYQLSLDVT